jgi:hypothetical protein
LDKFEPDRDVLLRALAAHVTDEMLECISMSDYGCDCDAHMAALRQLGATGWVPMEVLELIRWSEPKNPEWRFALRLEPALADENLNALAQWVLRRADELNWRFCEFPGLKGMVIGCQKRSAWEMFGLKLADFDLGGRSTESQSWVSLIAEQLVD